MTCQLVGTGWYSTLEKRDYATFGDDDIRQADFRSLWWQSMNKYVAPEHIVIVDSASPVKINDNAYTTIDIKKIELLINLGHSQNCIYHYCGYMAGVISILEYALYNDVDYVLYVEQDALVFGSKFIILLEEQLAKNDIVFGKSAGPIQQSIFAINKRAIRKFISNLHKIEFSDKEIMPEIKFMLAASKCPSNIIGRTLSYSNPPIIRKMGYKIFKDLISPICRDYMLLPFGYGRIRPIDFDDDVFYFQQGSKSEISKYKEKAGF